MATAADTARLRERREQLGLTLEQVSHDTRIPVAALSAIEAGKLDSLPDGPYRQGFVRTYRKHLGLSVDPTPAPVARQTQPPPAKRTDSPPPARRTPPAVRPRTPLPVVRTEQEAEIPPPVPPKTSFPLWLVRSLALISCLGLAAMIAWQLRGIELPTETPIPTDEFDQRVSMTVVRTFLLKAEVDGELVIDRQVEVDETFDLAGKDQIVIHLPGADTVRLAYNGRAIVPQGRQDEPRVLKFIDDQTRGP